MVFHLARKLAATVLFQDTSDPSAARELEEAGVPVSHESCRTCADPCDEGHEEFARRFDVDMETEMRGSVKPYRRQVLISTGKSDWARKVANESGSLASYVSAAEDSHSSSSLMRVISISPSSSPPITNHAPTRDPSVSGVYNYKPAGRLSILNASHTSRADDPDTHETEIVLPDYVAVSNVPHSAAGASEFWKHSLDPGVARAGTVVKEETGRELRTWVLPYNCLIMLCSHKTVDTRCHIASVRLEEDFTRTLESLGWAVDTDLGDLSSFELGPPLEESGSTDEEREDAARAQLRSLSLSPPSYESSESESESKSPHTQTQPEIGEEAESGSDKDKQEKKALILKTSHVGGHKFAGNVIIYLPTGSSIWYGRVTPHTVPSIVHQTILGGKVVPQLLRGGLGVVRREKRSLLDW